MRATIMLAVLVLMVGASCSEEQDPSLSASSTGSPTGSDPQPFDRLSITLELTRTEVQAGGQIGSRLVVENHSGEPVTDPGCLLSAPSFALIPVDDPDAELWGQIVVDCSGPTTMGPGFEDRFSGPTFRATDKYGDPLPSGDYLAALELQRSSKRFTVPVSITE